MNFFSKKNDQNEEGGRGRGPGRGRRRRRRGGRVLTLADIDHGGLMDMGFIRGATGKVLREALLKDPIELEMMGYKISLRRAEAREIFVDEIW
jgi:hypothetical protein